MGVNLVVGSEFAADPIAGLSSEQRAILRPGDRVEAMGWTDTEREWSYNEEVRVWTGRGWADPGPGPEG